jgi:hypothetical protein
MREKEFYVPTQMIDARACSLGTLLRLRKDERALNNGLHVKRQAFCGPLAIGDAPLAHRSLNIGLKGSGVAEDTRPAGVADRRMSVKDVLNHCSGEAGELMRFAPDESLAEIDVSQNSVKGIRKLAVGCVLKSVSRLLIPIGCSGESQIFLAAEMVEETTFGYPRGSANVLHTRRAIALGTHHIQGRLQQFDF